MITRLIAIATIFLLPLAAKGQCSGSFTYSVNGLTATFTSTTNPPATPNTSYYWWFSDMGNNSSVQHPVYTFSGPGTYVVCFSFYDFATQCQDSVCQSVTVGGCTADFTSIDSAGYTYFMSTTTAANPTYYWDFGDGNFSNQAYPWHQYANPGTYTVCLTVYDSAQVFCDSTCHTVIVQGQGGCTATFTSVDSLGYVFFLSSTTAGAGAMYFWDFGDGNYSSAANPSHIYGAPGLYTVCLTVYDSMQNFCDSTCMQVQVSTVGVQENLHWQNPVIASPNPADGMLSLAFIAPEAGNATIRFYDAAGRIANEKIIPVNGTGTNKTEINTSAMARGIYLVKIEIGGTEAWTRIAVTHQ